MEKLFEDLEMGLFASAGKNISKKEFNFKYKEVNKDSYEIYKNVLFNKQNMIDLLDPSKVSNDQFTNNLFDRSYKNGIKYKRDELNCRGRYYEKGYRFDSSPLNTTMYYDEEKDEFKILTLSRKNYIFSNIAAMQYIDFKGDPNKPIKLDIEDVSNGKFKANWLGDLYIQEFEIRFHDIAWYDGSIANMSNTIYVITIKFNKELETYNGESDYLNIEKIIYDYYNDNKFNKNFYRQLYSINDFQTLLFEFTNLKYVDYLSENKKEFLNIFTDKYNYINGRNNSIINNLILNLINCISDKKPLFDILFENSNTNIFGTNFKLWKEFVFYILDNYKKASYDNKLKQVLLNRCYDEKNEWNNFIEKITDDETKILDKKTEGKYIDIIFKLFSKKKFKYTLNFLKFINTYNLDFSKLSSEKMINDAGPYSYYTFILKKHIDENLEYILLECAHSNSSFLPLLLFIENDKLTEDLIKENGSYIAYYLFEYATFNASINYTIPFRFINRENPKYEIIISEFRKYTEKQSASKIKTRIEYLYKKNDCFATDLYNSLYNSNNKTINKILMENSL